ncbi:hypothetical protein CANINC_002964 [Pichia inconspicua]|uniref:Mitochondrial transcription factor 1 n=1 Tax=Pichia inconspicua TaxID=52247 RepID=A0A4T0WZW9_9ASCO|nr:hypothetical protein CANINC_002964 [[Candida] inconspicua]
MQKFYASQKSFSGALEALKTKKIKGFRFLYDESIYDEIFDRVGINETYLSENGTPTGKLNILDYHVRLSPMTYLLNKRLSPQNHLIIPDGQAATKFWERIKDNTDDLINSHVFSTGISTTVKANLLTKPLKENKFSPEFLPAYSETEIEHLYKVRKEPVNNTILFIGDFMSTTQASALRTCIYYNEVKTSMFRYGGVKFLAWTTPNEVLKYVGPLGSIHRRTNSLMANLYADVRVVACTENMKNPKAMKHLGDSNFVKLPYNEFEGEVCLVEFQSNHFKYKIDHQDELHLIIHKLFATPGALVVEKLHVLGPGAEEYLRAQLDPSILNKKVSLLTEEELIKISEEYYYWPFKPDTNLETYSNQDSFFDND